MKYIFCAILAIMLLITDSRAANIADNTANEPLQPRISTLAAAQDESLYSRHELTFMEKKAFLGRVYPMQLFIEKYSPVQAKIPVLLYHNIGDMEGRDTLAAADFAAHMAILRDNGYTTVSLKQMLDYVTLGLPLPEKPVCITFDDGYLSNYEDAFPILRENKQKAAIFVIGHSVGKSEFKDTGIPIIPHFSFLQAREMVESGLISIESHSFDMHPSNIDEFPEMVRESFLTAKAETLTSYRNTLRADYRKSAAEIRTGTGISPIAFAFPKGENDRFSLQILKTLGVKMTFCIFGDANILVPGKPESLHLLNRFYVVKSTTAQDILDYADKAVD